MNYDHDFLSMCMCIYIYLYLCANCLLEVAFDLMLPANISSVFPVLFTHVLVCSYPFDIAFVAFCVNRFFVLFSLFFLFERPKNTQRSQHTLYLHVLTERLNPYPPRDNDGVTMGESAMNNRLLPVSTASSPLASPHHRVYNPTTVALSSNGSNYSPILSETSSFSDADLNMSQRHPQANELGLPLSGSTSRWQTGHQRHLLQARAQSFVNSQGKTETDIF